MAASEIPLRKIDHVRFFVGNARQSAYFYRNAYGFDVVAYAGLETKVKHEAGYVLQQGGITFVLISPLRSSHPDAHRLSLHGDGVADIALQVDDVRASYNMPFGEVFEQRLDPGQYPAGTDRKSTRLNSSHIPLSRMPSSA